MIQRPVAVGLALCEQVIVEEKTRNVTLVNCFLRRRVRAFPSEPQHLAVFAALTDGLGEMTIGLVVQRLDTLEEVYALQNRLRFTDPLQEVRVLFRLNQLSFPAPGHYQFALFAEGELVAHRVMEVSPTEDQQ